MFTITNDKNKIIAKRTLKLSKSTVLPAANLLCNISVDLGIDLNGEGKNIVAKFDKLFNGKVSKKIKKQDDQIDTARRLLARMLHENQSEAKIKQFADVQQEEIIRDWNTFARIELKRAALDAVDDSIKSLGAKTSIVFKDLKIKYENNELNDQKMKFMTGVLDLAGQKGATGRKTSGGMAALVSTLGNVNTNMRGYLGGWAANVKLFKQAANDANIVRNNIAQMSKATKTLSARLERIKKIEAATKARITGSVAQGEKTVAELEKAAKVAVLNQQQKIAPIAKAAGKSFAEASNSAKKMDLKGTDSSKLETLLKDINNKLQTAEIMAKKQSESIMKSARIANEIFNDSKKGAQAVTMVLKELKIQSRQL